MPKPFAARAPLFDQLEPRLLRAGLGEVGQDTLPISSFTASLRVSEAAHLLSRVWFNGSDWRDDLEFDLVAGPSSNISEPKAIPFRHINRVAIEFGVPVDSVAANAISIYGVRQNVLLSSAFHFDTLTQTASWDFDHNLVGDKLLLVVDPTKIQTDTASLAHIGVEPILVRANLLPHDVNGDGTVSALDPLLVINWLNEVRAPDTNSYAASTAARMLDLNSDGAVTAIDALFAINGLNRAKINSTDVAISLPLADPVRSWDAGHSYRKNEPVLAADGNYYHARSAVARGQAEPHADLLQQVWQLDRITVPTSFVVHADGHGRENFRTLWKSLLSAKIEANVQILFTDKTYQFQQALNLNHPDGRFLQLLGTGETELVFTAAPGSLCSAGLIVDGAVHELQEVNGFVIRGTYEPWEVWNPHEPGKSKARIQPAGTPLEARCHGIWATHDATLRLGSDVVVRNFYYGITAETGGVVYADGTEVWFGGDANYFAYRGGTVYARNSKSVGAADARAQAGRDAKGQFVFDAWGHGYVAETVPFDAPVKSSAHAIRDYQRDDRSYIYAEGSESAHHLIAGYFSNLGAVLYAADSWAHGNRSSTSIPGKAFKHYGYWSNAGSVLDATGARSENNDWGFYAQDDSSLTAATALASGNLRGTFLADASSSLTRS